MTPDLRLDIGELVLEGFPPGDRPRLVEALRRELARLLGEPGAADALARLPSRDRVSAVRFAASPGDRPELIGVRVARAIVEGLQR